MTTPSLMIIIHTELLVAKINRVFPFSDKEGNIFLILPGQYFFNIARTLCDQSFNIDLRLRYVVRIHRSENRAMPCPP